MSIKKNNIIQIVGLVVLGMALIGALLGSGLGRTQPGLELFEQLSEPLDQFRKELNYQRAMQNELAQTLELLEGVKKARVHLAFPKSGMDFSKGEELKAAIVLFLNNNELPSAQANHLAQLVMSSVEGLSRKNISLFDHKGQLLYLGEQESQPNDLEKNTILQKEIEESLRQHAQFVLDTLLGPKAASVQVRVELNFEQSETISEMEVPVDPLEDSSLTKRIVQRTVHDGGVLKKVSAIVFLDASKGPSGFWTAAKIEGYRSVLRQALGIELERGDSLQLQLVELSKPDKSVLEELVGFWRDYKIPLSTAVVVILLAGLAIMRLRAQKEVWLSSEGVSESKTQGDLLNISDLVEQESAQAGAVILLQLPPDQAALVLERQTPTKRVEILDRMSNVQYLSPEVIERVQDLTNTKSDVLENLNANQNQKHVCRIVRCFDESQQKKILQEIAQAKPQLYKKIMLFKSSLEDVIWLSDNHVQKALTDIDRVQLALALKMADIQVVDKFKRNMSYQEFKKLRKQIDKSETFKLKDVEMAQDYVWQVLAGENR